MAQPCSKAEACTAWLSSWHNDVFSSSGTFYAVISWKFNCIVSFISNTGIRGVPFAANKGHAWHQPSVANQHGHQISAAWLASRPHMLIIMVIIIMIITIQAIAIAIIFSMMQ